MKVKDVARICHETNRAYCESLGDFSQSPWDLTPETIQQSAIDGVRYHLSNEGTTPEGSHENWLKFKEAEGWVYGEEKNLELKTHPCMVPYNELPTEQRVKDYLFRGVVDSLRSFVERFENE